MRLVSSCRDNDDTKVKCNCKNDRGCRRLDIVLSQVRPILCFTCLPVPSVYCGCEGN
jgi:hypothetical protein